MLGITQGPLTVPLSSSICAPKLCMTPSSFFSLASSSASCGFLGFLFALPGPGKTHSIPALLQFVHEGWILSQRTFLRRHVTQLRWLRWAESDRAGCLGLVLPLLVSGVFFTSTESEPAGVDSDILFHLPGSAVGDWMKCGCSTFAGRIVSVRQDVRSFPYAPSLAA